METADNRNANEHALGVGTFFDFKRVNPTRSIAGFSLGAVIGLGIAGYGLLTAQGTSTHIVPPENVADRKSTRLNSSHSQQSRMPSSA